jgi:hypothetical protein
VSEQQVWLSRELAEHIRKVLDPMVALYSSLASGIGGNPDRQVERAHHVGRAQGLLDAMRALDAPAAVSEVPPADEGPGQVTADAVRRMRKNAGPKHRATP